VRSGKEILMAVRDEVRDAQRALAALDTAHSRAVTRIARLADAVENGTFALGEVEERLRQHREKRDRAKAVIAAAQGPAGRLDPQVIDDLFQRLGGLVALADRLTMAEQQALFEATELSIRFDPVRQAIFKAEPACGVSVRVGGGT
jgi:chromosome segregation ATPase